MTWSPKFGAVQEEALIDNVLTIVERDMKSALDVRYPTEAALASTDPLFLSDFRERALGQILRNEFPCLAIGPNRQSSSSSEDSARLVEEFRFDSYLGVTDDTPERVTRRIMRYVSTYDAVLRSARIFDYFANMSAKTFGFVLEMDHIYGPIGAEKSVLFRGAVIQATIKLSEG